MKSAFTLIELLVVLIIMTVIMGIVMPKGAKMLHSYEKSLQNTKDQQILSKERSLSFLRVEEKNINILGILYHISEKGVLTQYEKSNDND